MPGRHEEGSRGNFCRRFHSVCPHLYAGDSMHACRSSTPLQLQQDGFLWGVRHANYDGTAKRGSYIQQLVVKQQHLVQ